MRDTLLLALAVWLGMGSQGPAQERQRVVVVRDDDGTPDAGRGQVSGPTYVCRKTLNLDRDPAGITSARLMYYMKHSPYDVATKTLHRAPVAGVTWSNFVVTLNDHEVLH